MTNAFATILRGCKWILRRWYIPVIGLAALAGLLVGRRRLSPRQAVGARLDQIRHREGIERYAIDRGHRLANELLDHQYRREIQELDERQREKAEALRADPGRRVAYLRRLSERLKGK